MQHPVNSGTVRCRLRAQRGGRYPAAALARKAVLFALSSAPIKESLPSGPSIVSLPAIPKRILPLLFLLLGLAALPAGTVADPSPGVMDESVEAEGEGTIPPQATSPYRPQPEAGDGERERAERRQSVLIWFPLATLAIVVVLVLTVKRR